MLDVNALGDLYFVFGHFDDNFFRLLDLRQGLSKLWLDYLGLWLFLYDFWFQWLFLLNHFRLRRLFFLNHFRLEYYWFLLLNDFLFWHRCENLFKLKLLLRKRRGLLLNVLLLLRLNNHRLINF